MSKPERTYWTLAVIICLVIPLALGYYDLALVGGVSLAVLWWRLRRDKLL